MEKQFVLVHGAWHGGWCWDSVIPELIKAGYKAEAPTMPGHHLSDSRSGIQLEDYINSIMDVIKASQVPVILVGHSSAGFLLQSAAGRMPEKIEHLIFNNAFILPDGKCQFDLVPPEISKGMTQAAGASPDDCVPVMEDFVRNTLMADASPKLQDDLIKNLVPQPLALFTTPIELKGLDIHQFKKTVIHCNKDISLPAGAYLGMAQGLGEYKLIELDLGHEGLYTHPKEIAQALVEAVQ